MSQNSLLSVLVLIAGVCAAQDGEDMWNQCGETVIPACRAYVAAFSTEKEIAAWNKKMDDRIKQKVSDAGADDDSALQSIALDWASDNKGKLEQKERKAIKEACLLFLRFWDKKIPPPGQIRERMSMQNAKELADYLNDEVETKKMSKGPLKTPQTVDVRQERLP